jgi:recombinational DNA repair ATPase RecF
LSKIEIINSTDSKNIEFLSSGEQRLLLNQLVINFIKVQVERGEKKPIMLLDDILTFFDEKNQNILVQKLLDLDLQFFITTNNFKLREEITDKIQIISDINI